MSVLTSFYMDLVTIIRTVDDNSGYITRKEEVTIAENVPCRIHKNPVTYSDITKSNAEVLHDDKLSCHEDVDIQAGDKLIVVRGGRLGKSKTTETYIAGYPKIFYQPFGGITPNINHQEVPLGGIRVI